MNALRRFCLAIYSLLLIAAAGALIALTWADNQQFDWTIGGWNFQALVNSSNGGKIVFTIILAVIAFIGLLTLILAVFRDSVRNPRGALRLRQTDGGTIEVTGRAIESLLRDELQRLPDVRSVDPHVRLVGGAVDTNLAAVIAPTANIATVTSTLSQGVSNILRDQVGVTNVRRPSIRIEQDAAPDYGRDGRSANDGGYAYRPEPSPAAVPPGSAPVADEPRRPSWPGTSSQVATTPNNDDTVVIRDDAPVTRESALPPPPEAPPASTGETQDSQLVPPALPSEETSATSGPSGAGHWEGDRWESGNS